MEKIMAFDNFRGRALSPETAAMGADCSVSQIHRLVAAGKIKAAKLGYRMTRLDGDSFADFLTSRLDEPRPPRGKHAKPKTSELAPQA
jgi:hypothetical protein